ncbi:MAG: hypothetical protein NZL93_03700, partial [Chthoniobacterales bacterium]|nr:hypothetical protein [Chthoniobacterales bacterium]
MKSLPIGPFALILTILLVSSCAKPLKPHELYYNVGQSSVGGPLRVQKDFPLPRNPPALPKIVKIDPQVANSGNTVSSDIPPPPAPTTSITTTAQSPVPPEADAYFQQPPPPQTTALGALFQAIFQPPPTPPPAESSASY